MEKAPRVSIGVPVRNGQRFIRQALDSLLNQTFESFEIVICDNASTDSTESICREYAARDHRVRYIRNPVNLGPAQNYNRTFELSRGEHFRWHAHDDMVAPEYLTRCVETLDRQHDVVLAYPRTLIVDEFGNPLENYDFHPRTDSANAAERFASLVLVNHRKHRACEIFGLMRSAAVRQTPLQGAYARGDSVFLARLALIGRFIEIPDRLFLSRSHASQSMQTLPSESSGGRSRWTRMLGTGPLPPPEWWDASRKGKANFPEWNLIGQYAASVAHARLGIGAKLQCGGVLLSWVLRNSHKLARDVIFAGETIWRQMSRRLDDNATSAHPLPR